MPLTIGPTGDSVRTVGVSDPASAGGTEIARLANHLRRGHSKLTLVLGAGMSLGAGVPLARGWVPLLWLYHSGVVVKHEHVQTVLKVQRADSYSLSEYGSTFEAAAHQAVRTIPEYNSDLLTRHPGEYVSEYMTLMAALDSSEQQDFISRLLDACSPLRITWPYIRVAELVRRGLVHTILTTNLDLVLLEALSLYGIFPAICDHHQAAQLRSTSPLRPQVIYLHGNVNSYNVRNARSVVELYDSEMDRLLRWLVHDTTLLTVGYAGWEDGLMRVLSDLFGRQQLTPHELFWSTLSTTPPQSLRDSPSVHTIPRTDAETLFERLAAELGMAVPEVADNPLNHTLKLLERLDLDSLHARAYRLSEKMAAVRAAMASASEVQARNIRRHVERGKYIAARNEFLAWIDTSAEPTRDQVALLELLAERSQSQDSLRPWLVSLYERMTPSFRDRPAIRRHFVDALVTYGDSLESRGHLGRAMEVFSRGYGEALSLCGAKDGDGSGDAGNDLLRKSSALSRLATVYFKHFNDLDVARDLFQEVLIEACRGRDSYPDAPEWAHEVSGACDFLGDIAMRKRDAARALQWYETSQAAIRDAVSRFPGNRILTLGAAITEVKRFDAMVALSDLDGAALHLATHLRDVEHRAAAEIGGTDWRRHLAVVLQRLGDVERRRSRLADALYYLRRAQVELQQLYERDTRDVGAAHDAAVAYQRVADILRRLKEYDLALDQLQKDRTLTEGIVARDRSNPRWVASLATTYADLRETSVQCGKLEEAADWALKEVDTRAKLVELSRGSRADIAALAISRISYATLLVRTGRRDDAAYHYEEGRARARDAMPLSDLEERALARAQEAYAKERDALGAPNAGREHA